MTEPLFLVATIAIGERALRRWLKSAPLSVAAFDDWPEELADNPVETSPESSVADALVAYCIDSLGAEEGYLHCTYDDAAKELHFAAFYRWGDEARTSALSLCALLRGIAEFYTAKTPSYMHLYDFLSVEIQKNATRILPEPLTGEPEQGWFYEWLDGHPGDPDWLMAGLLPSLARALKKRTSLGALHASPQSRYRYDGNFWTDGQHVYSGPYDKPEKLEDTDPLTFRRITPSNATGAAFYADRQRVWYHHNYSHAMVIVQRIEPGVSVRGWTPYGMDGEPLLCYGDTIWTVTTIDCSDHEKNEANRESAQSVIASCGGIIVYDTAYDGVCGREYRAEYLRPARVDGHSFTQVKDALFEDDQAVYYQSGEGLVRMEGMIPGKTTFAGNLSCNNGQTFFHSRKTRCQPDTASLHHIYGRFNIGGLEIYSDNHHIYMLCNDKRDPGYFFDLYRLEDADPASFKILQGFWSFPICRDDRHVWIGLEMVPEAHPDSVRFFRESQYWIAGSQLFHDSDRVSGVDIQDFKPFPESNYGRRRDSIYYRADPVPGADADTFVTDGYHDAHDKYRAYKGESVVVE